MKVKNILLIISLLFITILHGQNPSISDKLPEVIPPSPTVAALMKFEEVPVSNYTGIPDVSIPLFETSTNTKGVNLTISLKYHPNQIAALERSSDVGLGWSLFAGGTISRTVRGLPDEFYDSNNILSGGGKIGIYHTEGNYKNNYYKFLNYFNNQNTSNFSADLANKYMWDAGEKGSYDSEHDMWQVSFMGKSASFFISKNTVTQQLEIKNLDITSNLKIINHYNANTYEPTSFEVFDDYGNKYIFDVVEETTSNTITTTTYFQFSDVSPVSNTSEPTSHKSAFHLSKIYNANGKLIIDFKYTNNLEGINYERISNVTNEEYSIIDPLTYNSFHSNYLSNTYSEGLSRLEVSTTSTISNRNTSTKKLKEIIISDRCKIDFNFIQGREDSNMVFPNTSYIFKGIDVKDLNGMVIKRVSLEHDYFEFLYKRLFLKNVHVQNSASEDKEVYNLEYKEYNQLINGDVKADYFGYFTIRPSNYNYMNYFYREVNPEVCSTEILQKMTLPTGGSIVFDYEPNTYSYIGDELIDNFDSNMHNWNYLTNTIAFTNLNFNLSNSNNGKKAFFTLYQNQDVLLTSFYSGNATLSYFYTIYLLNENTNSYSPVGSIDYISCEQMGDCNLLLKDLSPGKYFVGFTNTDSNFPTVFSAEITANFKEKNNNDFQFLYGGGNRIKRIGYFENGNISKSYYDDNLNSLYEPSRELNYSYNQFNTPYSSGSLVVGLPKFSYEFNRITLLKLDLTGGYIYKFSPSINMLKHTDYNNIKSIKTSGSDVGYKNVKVEEQNNGFTEYTYASPIDFPELINNTYPFLPHNDSDYKRGKLQSEKKYNFNHKPLLSKEYNYSYEEAPTDETIYGIRFSALYNINGTTFYNNPYSFLFSDYNIYKGSYSCLSGGNYLSVECTNNFQAPVNYFLKTFLKSSNGWAKLTSTNTKEYFYPSGSATANVVETNETYSYNPINKQIAESTVTNSNGEVLKTNYYYHTGNSIHSQNRISEIEKVETYRNGQLLSTSKINYANNWGTNISYLPQTIQSSKGANALETKVKYNKYDEFSNPLEVQQEGGIKISYIWGYNKTQPVAKLENIAYDAIPGSLITAIQSATDSPTPNETTILNALNSLRTSTDVNLQKAMITTYTYKPLVGITSVTDQKGDKQTYHYDSFNRLEFVKDKNGNILSENKYHYRTQN